MFKVTKLFAFLFCLCFVFSTQSLYAADKENGDKDKDSSINTGEMKSLRLIKEAYLKMNKFYFKDINIAGVGNLFYRSQFIMMSLLRNLDDDYQKNLDKLTYSTINLIVEALKDPSDDYSKFIHKDYLKRVIRENLKSKFKGIGIEIVKKDVLFFISRVYKDSSAFEEGVLKDDQLLAINGELVEGWELKQIEKLLKIPEGETVELTLLHPDEKVPYEVMLVCRTIWIPSVLSKYYKKEKIGYIQIKKFRDLTAEEFKKELDKLRKEKLVGLVIDLRGNSGGDETQAVALSSLFLKNKTLVVYFLKKDVGRQEEKTKGEPEDFPYPVVILVDKGSASSSEIFSGTLQHYKKAVLVGTKTKGQGSLKNTIGLSDGSALFLITSRTYLPNEKTFDQIGITPDFIVEDEAEQLVKAFDIIMGKK